MKMNKYGGENEEDIRFNLLALVQDRYETYSDQLEVLKRQKGAIERQLDSKSSGWRTEVCFP